MNLNNEPTLEQLKKLFESCNDDEGHHILWVSRNGEVLLSLVPTDSNPIAFENSKSEMQCRYETFSSGSGYVGRNAAKDESFMQKMFGMLVSNWPSINGHNEVKYIDC